MRKTYHGKLPLRRRPIRMRDRPRTGHQQVQLLYVRQDKILESPRKIGRVQAARGRGSCSRTTGSGAAPYTTYSAGDAESSRSAGPFWT